MLHSLSLRERVGERGSDIVNCPIIIPSSCPSPEGRRNASFKQLQAIFITRP
jgi:hypothetical protein